MQSEVTAERPTPTPSQRPLFLGKVGTLERIPERNPLHD